MVGLDNYLEKYTNLKSDNTYAGAHQLSSRITITIRTFLDTTLKIHATFDTKRVFNDGKNIKNGLNL